MRPVRIALTNGETAGFIAALARGFAGIGCRPEVYFIAQHPFDYENPYRVRPIWLRFAQITHRNFVKRQGFKRLAFRIMLYGFCFFGTIHIASRCKVIVVNNGRSLLPLSLDLLIYRLFRRKIISCHCHGSPSRSAWSNCLEARMSLSGQQIQRDHRRVIRKVKLSTALSTHVLGSETLRELVPRQTWCIEQVGFPVILPQIEHAMKPERGTPLIVHIPSNVSVKGSKIIREVISELKTSYNLNYEEYRDLPHSEVVKIFSRADLVVDQLFADRRFSITAAECALLGTPCLTYGYATFSGNLRYDIESSAGVLREPSFLRSDLVAFLEDPVPFRAAAENLKVPAGDFFCPERIAGEILKSLSENRNVEFKETEVYLLGAGSSLERLQHAQVLRAVFEPKVASQMKRQLGKFDFGEVKLDGVAHLPQDLHEL